MTEIKAWETQAQFALDKALRDQQRVQNLYADSVATLEQLQNASTSVDMAGKALEIAQFNVTYSEVRSPIDGKIVTQMLLKVKLQDLVYWRITLSGSNNPIGNW
jgi:multidrug resistance efflux pump